MKPDLHNQIGSAVALLRAGGTVAFPTETVYGLGADVSNFSAVQRIFEIKKRPADHPLIVHFADTSRLHYWARDVPEQAWQLAEHFWPGPLTLILPRSHHVPENVTGGQDTVGLRVPDHPVALALLTALGTEGALAAPSANRFGHISPTTAAHVQEELGQTVDMILDGGACEIGLESTIVGFSGQTAVILRPGGISLAAVAEVLGDKVVLPEKENRTVRVPGALASHYAPVTPLELCPTESLWRRALELESAGLRVVVMEWSARKPDHPENTDILHFPMPRKPAAYGSLLYATLRRFDHEGLDRLLVEAPPDQPVWAAIADRLQRASCVPGFKAQADDHDSSRMDGNMTHEAV
ncbi:L-threonylcarbamoyladenylate synthase [Nitrosospira sp. Nl5]|uniref:L-threonylcarbamoyladenylate synthase n=1 Tax=Nitrosospira sp. Nl5 TaxID=200120 RepID=UPI000B8301F0|nr:L-threonylcarbamoyladenylate synthase [Nitrosospira sp. Nl5]